MRFELLCCVAPFPFREQGKYIADHLESLIVIDEGSDRLGSDAVRVVCSDFVSNAGTLLSLGYLDTLDVSEVQDNAVRG